jgi:hypothetical protein
MCDQIHVVIQKLLYRILIGGTIPRDFLVIFNWPKNSPEIRKFLEVAPIGRNRQ